MRRGGGRRSPDTEAEIGQARISLPSGLSRRSRASSPTRLQPNLPRGKLISRDRRSFAELSERPERRNTRLPEAPSTGRIVVGLVQATFRVNPRPAGHLSPRLRTLHPCRSEYCQESPQGLVWVWALCSGPPEVQGRDGPRRPGAMNCSPEAQGL